MEHLVLKQVEVPQSSCSPLRAHAEGFLKRTAAHGEPPPEQTLPEELLPMGKIHTEAEKNSEKKGAAKFYGLTKTRIPYLSVLLRRRREKRHERRSEAEPVRGV